MNQFVAISLVVVALFALGCDSEDDSAAIPAIPTSEMLEAGPGSGAEFLQWNDTGRERAGSAGGRAEEWVTNTDTTHIQIEDMVGLFVYPGCLGSHTALNCDIVVADSNWAQLEYGPTGMEFAAPVKLWLDSNVVAYPVGMQASDVAYYFYNPESGEFEEMTTWINPNNGWIEAQTDHFSRYILGRKQNF